MGLASHALALGLGYVLGHPAGRAQARKVPGQVAELAKRPQVQQARDRGKVLAGQAVQTAKQRISRDQGSTASTASTGSTATGAGTGGADAVVTEHTGREIGGWRVLGRRGRRRAVLAPSDRPGDPDTVATDTTALDEAGYTGAPVGAETEAAVTGTLPPADPKRSPSRR